MPAFKRQLPIVCTLSLLTILSVFAFGCGGGGSNNTTATTPAPNPSPSGTASPAPTPMPSPTPTPTPTPTPAPSPNTSGMFQAKLFSGFGSAVQNKGQVTVDATAIDGNGTVQLTGATATTSFTLMFCPFPSEKYSCFTVTTLTTDASGAAQATFHFPSGIWAGDFQVMNGTTMFASTAFDFTTSNQSYTAALQPETKTNPNGINQFPVPAVPQDPLSSGKVTVSGSNAQVMLQGAFPSATYNVTLCTLGDGSGCFQQPTSITTDASGNAQTSVPLTPEGGDIIFVERSAMPSGFGFIAGFQSP